MEAEQTTQHPGEAPAQDEHRWLQRMIGDWTMRSHETSDASMDKEIKLTETVRALGDVWVVAEGTAVLPDGATSRSMMTLGYDPAKGRFVGTWVGSAMTNLWVYDGELDESGNVLTLNCEGPSMAGDGTIWNYRDVIELIGDDERTLTSYAKQSDGQWQRFMQMRYVREK